MATWCEFSATPDTGNEAITYNVNELYGNYYLVVAGHTNAIGPVQLDLSVTPDTTYDASLLARGDNLRHAAN